MAKTSSTVISPDTSDTTPIDKGESATYVERSIDPENEVLGVRLIIIHIGTTLVTFLAGLTYDSNLIATSIPVITSEFNSFDDVGWYGSAFYIAMCAGQPLAGKIYTLFSKKLVLLVYLFIFEIGNLVCALAPSSRALIVGRGFTGLGASGVFVGAIAILTTIIPLHKRAIWQGTQVATFSTASIVGPVIGGSLTESLTWRWCFWINLPCGAVAAALVLFLKIRKPDEPMHWPLLRKLQALDFVGFFLLAGAITMVLLAMQFGGVDYAWDSSVVIGLFVGSAATFSVFVYWQNRRQDNTLVPPKLLRYKNASLLLVSQLFGLGFFQVIVYWLPIWFQAVLGVSPLASGIRYLPTVISDALTCIIGSAIIMQLGMWNPFLLLSFVLISLSGGLLSTIVPGVLSANLIGYEILGGVGFGLINNVAHIGMQASIPKELVPIGASTLMAVMSSPCAIYLAAGQTAFQDRLTANLTGKISSELIQRLLASGATSIRSFISPDDLVVIINGYSKSIAEVFVCTRGPIFISIRTNASNYLPAAAAAVGFLISSGLKWTSLKKGKTIGDLENDVKGRYDIEAKH